MSLYVADFIDEENRKILHKNMAAFTRKVKIEKLLGTLFSEEVISYTEMKDLSAKKGKEREIAELLYMKLMRGRKSVLEKVKDILYNDGQVDIAQLIPNV